MFCTGLPHGQTLISQLLGANRLEGAHIEANNLEANGLEAVEFEAVVQRYNPSRSSSC